MSRFKHNKRKNTAFLYEALVLELTKAVVAKNVELKNFITSILKEHFQKGTILYEELRLYKDLYETVDVDPLTAEKILQETKKQYAKLSKQRLALAQSDLFFLIKKNLGEHVFSNFVPNYKNLASLSQIFNIDVSVKSRVILENEIIEKMSNTKKLVEEQKMVPIDNLVLKSFISKFNTQYKTLHEEQRNLLSKYIISFSDNGLSMKTFLNEEIGRLKDEIKKSMELSEIKENVEMHKMTSDVSSLLEGFTKQEIDNKMVEQIIKIQNLVREIKSNDNPS